MKAKTASLLVVILLTTIQCTAQKRITVEAQSYDISNNLDLQAVASVFGESKDLQDFEMKLNDYDSQISNLDLNNDGEVDYLRVIESTENNVHLVVIQAVLGKNEFQDVATIVVEKNQNRRTYVQVIGDPYLYGDNYIIEPVYVYTPSIFSFFWSDSYSRWYSPYYWGYYPSHFRYHNPYEVNVYLSRINSRINHDHRYYYTERRRSESYDRLHNSVGRNDYGNRHPENTFSGRNKDTRNKQEFDNKRSGGERSIPTRQNYQGNDAGRRTYDNASGTRTERNQNSGRNSNSGANDRMTQPRTTTPTSTPRNQDVNRGQGETNQSRPATNQNRETYQTRPSTNVNNESRPNNPVVRDNNTRNSTPNPVVRENNQRPAPAVSQPSSRSTEAKPVERKATESRGNDSKPEGGSRSSDNNTNRR
ncbi:MAG: hypothetical protein WCG93_02860 [Paludibacter sp.]